MRREWFVLGMAMIFPSAIAAIYFVALAGPVDGQKGNVAVQIVYSCGKVFQFALPVTYLAMVDRSYLRTFRLSPNGLGFGIAFGLIVAGGIIALAGPLADNVLVDSPARIRAKVAEFGVLEPKRFIGLALFLSLLHSLLEESYYRWFIFGRLRLVWSFWPAALVSGLAFMGHHVFVLYEYLPGKLLTGVVPFAMAIAVGGVIWAWLYEKTGSLLGPWISHLIVDAAIMFVGYRLTFGR